MYRDFTVKISILLLLALFLVAAPACDAVRGGATVHLRNIDIGELSQSGKPIAGIPTDTVDIVLKVAADEVIIQSTDNGAIITLQPSGAIIEAGPDGMSVTGVDPDKIDIKWQDNN
jgi:hypothetical protein